ncbi:MAG: SurA N-terminal domain-containing protein, partial [Gammaproteobacteria bacterium]|nr:SurA N-terminal domain-containing protein [Gammaproteobacteria bacterium]
MVVTPIARAALLLLALIPLVLSPADRVRGQDAVRIAAVVNNEAISIPDLVARIDIAIVSSRLRASDELRRQLAPQVLRSLIDERLKVQEAERLGVSVSEAEMANARRAVEQRNGIP